MKTMSRVSVHTARNSGTKLLSSLNIQDLTSPQPPGYPLWEKQVWRVGERIWNTIAEANLFEGPEERKLPLYLIDGLYSRLFEPSGKMVSYLIIHLDIGIPCLSPAAYNYIATASVTPECCSVDDVVDLELKEQIIQVTKL